MRQRRLFLQTTATLGLTAFAPGLVVARADEKKAEEDVPATEDLMREHGVLNRALLIYEEGLRRLRERREVGPAVFQSTAQLVRRFVEDYHERLEERFIFPEFEKRGKLADLVRVLRQQ